jgi:hypothetical protein
VKATAVSHGQASLHMANESQDRNTYAAACSDGKLHVGSQMASTGHFE